MRAKNHHTVKMMLSKEHHKRVVRWTTRKMAPDFKKGPLGNALLTTVSGNRKKAAIWRLDDIGVGGLTI